MRHLEERRGKKIGWMRAAVLGADDGLWSTASRVVGVAAAGSSRRQVLLRAQSRSVLVLSAVLVVQSLGAIRCARAASEPAGQVYSLQNRFGIAVAFERKTGEYWVRYQGQPWFGAGDVSVLAKRRWYRSAASEPADSTRHNPSEGGLTLVDVRTTAGKDRLGAFDSLRLSWKVPDVDLMLITSFRLYRDAPYLLFGQEFPEGFKNYASGDWTVPSVAFPHFVGGSNRGDLYSWVSEGMDGHRFGYGSAFNLDKTVDLLVLSDRDYNTIILSPTRADRIHAQRGLT